MVEAWQIARCGLQDAWLGRETSPIVPGAGCRMQSAGCKLNGYRPGYYDIAFGSHDRPALRW